MEQPSTPQYPQIQAANVVSGADATSQAMSLANQYFAPQMAAQGQGLADIAQGQQYYNNFGPTSLEQAVGNQYFSNVWPQEQAMIQNQFANSGMNFSPAMASTEANAFGTLGTNVGEYLSNQSNTNASNNLNYLMNTNPNSYYQPISNAITGQSNEQASLSQQAAIQNAQAQYANSAANYNQQQATNGAIGSIGGAIAGGIGGSFAGNPVGGAMVGSSLGSAAFGGSPVNLGNAMQAYQYYGSQPGQMPGQSNGGTTVGNSTQPNYSNLSSNGYGTNNVSGVTNGTSSA